ncbi:hypothetical protein [Deinococcus pimensis]|uniref:hypothetical protein n=1 Tax=Deinococcus pimensis TaxID=309888 RepID=UPI00048587E8|nr:hypothetical protein [Deinococcus pimensis]
MTQLHMTLNDEPTALRRVLSLLARKQCAITRLYAQSEGPTLRVQVHFESNAVSAAHVMHLLGALHDVLSLTVNDTTL